MDDQYYKRLSLRIIFTFLKISGFAPVSIVWANSNLYCTPHFGWKIYHLIIQVIILLTQVSNEIHYIRFSSGSLLAIVQIIVPITYILFTMGISLPLMIRSGRVCRIIGKIIRASTPLNEVFWKYFLLLNLLEISFYAAIASITVSCINNWDNYIDAYAELVYSFCSVNFGAFVMLFTNLLLIVYFAFRWHNEQFEEYINDGLSVEQLNEFLERHSELCEISFELNKIFEVGTLTSTTEVLLEMLFNVALSLAAGYTPTSNLAWVVYVLIKQVTMVMVPSYTAFEAKRSLWILSSKTIDAFDDAIHDHAVLYALKRLHMDLKFDSCGFFNVNMKLLTTIISSTVTYGVIIYQFRK